ncbi:MAG: hypothetical protein QNJ48_10665, partial [Desulfobacterales bacterium]|nr:hypothetical protein [Desulfobacterales bacterium]
GKKGLKSEDKKSSYGFSRKHPGEAAFTLMISVSGRNRQPLHLSRSQKRPRWTTGTLMPDHTA